MVNNKKAYSKILLLIILLLAIIGTQSMAVTVSRVTGLKAEVVNNTTVNVSWNKLTNATNYEVYVKAPGKAYASLGKTNNRTSVTMNNLTANSTYYVKVRAYNGNTAGEFSNEITVTINNNNSNVVTTLGTVAGLRLNSVTENVANIAWNKVTNATGYEVYVKEQNGSYVNRGKTANLYTTLNSLTSGKTYYAKVRAYRIENGKTIYGDFSNELRVVTNNSSTTVTLGTVTNLRLNSVTENVANIAWNKVTNAAGYEVYVKEQNGSYVNGGKTTNLYAALNGLTAGKTYYAKVRAYRMENGQTIYGDFSNELRIVTNNSSATVTLGAVTNLRLNSVTENVANIAWNKVTNAAGYEVYVRELNGSYSSRGTTSNLYAVLNGLTAGKTYYVKVRAYRVDNGKTTYGDFSNELRVVTNNSSTTVTLGAVTNLRLNSVTETVANIAWNKVTNATGYEVYVRELNGSYSSRGTTSNLYAALNGLTAGKTYYVKVRAYRVDNGKTIYGDFSNELRVVTNNGGATVTVGTVTNLRLNSASETSASVTWNKVANVSGYEIYVREQSGLYKNIGNTINTNTTINGLEAGKTYYVKVRAFSMGNGQTVYGSFSNEISFSTTKTTTTPTATVDKVLNLKAVPTANRTALTWNKVANAEGYEVYVNIPGRGYISIGKTKYNDVGIIGLSVGKTYYIKVRAYNGTTYGEFSDEVKCTVQNETATSAIGTVTNLKSTVTGTETQLTWNTVENASKYEIFINIPGKGYTSLGTTSKNNVKVINLAKGVTYQIKVRAIGTVNGNTVYGDYSNEVTVLAK